MSPQAALESDVFRIYVASLLAALAVAGGLIAVLKYALKRNVDHAVKSYRGWLVMIPVVLLCLFLGRVPTIVFFVVAAVFAFKEYARATGLYSDWPMTGVVYCGIVALGIVTLAWDLSYNVPGSYGLFMALPVYVVTAILLVPILRNRAKGQLQAIALAIVGFIYIGWMFGHVAFLANSKHAYGYLFYLLVAVEANDVAAFTCGKLFGHRKLRSEISPNKTWGGSIGALVVSLVLPWLLRFSFPHFGVVELVLAGLIVGIGGQLGDLSMSVIKRDVGVKDMGALIPGHGGILDRIDSLIYTAPLFLHMARFFHDLY
jgi:phosphatidate cytidylyltransferase